MLLHNPSTITEHSDSSNRRYCGLTLREIVAFIGSLLLPLTLGVFTVVITLYQQNVATQQRLEDRNVAREQREQDLNISREQRQHDLNMLALQRELDLNISREQREQDKTIADDRLRDTILVTYLNDIANLLKENNGTLTANPVVATIARAKTLTVIRQLDSSRNSHLIKFLYEAKQLTSGANPLDLSNAELDEVNLTNSKNYHHNMHNLSLAGTLLRNSSFSYVDMSNANFSGADLTSARFEKSKLNNADMTRTLTIRASFIGSELINTNFDSTQARRTSFQSAKAMNATFTKGQMESADFSLCDCKDVNFKGISSERADFSKAHLDRTLFASSNLLRANFSYAHLIGTNLRSAQLRFSDFFHSFCEGTIFTNAQLMESRFVQTLLKDIDLTNLNMQDVDFTGADLTLTSLSSTKLDRAIFNETTIVMTNFSFASLKKALISDEQLSNAISIQGATLPNGTVMDRDPNLLYNGHADCDAKLLNSSWRISPPDAIVIVPKHDSPQDCRFVNQINGSSFMSQRTNLTRFIPITSRNRAVLVLTIRGAGNISSVRIDDHADRLLVIGNFTQKSDLLTLRVHSRSYEPKVTIQFFGYGWCDDIELKVELGPRVS